MKEYTKKIGEVEVVYTLINRKLRKEMTKSGINLSALQKGQKIEDAVDFVFDNCVKNSDDCEGFTLSEEIEVMNTVISDSYGVGDKASKN